MKVALVAPPYHSHEIGLGRSVRELAHGVARIGGCVEVLAHLPESVRASAANHGILVHHIRPQVGSGYAAPHAIRSHLRQHGGAYDLVHAHGYMTLPAVLAARGLYGRLVFSPRYDGVPRSRFGQMTQSPYRQLGRTALASADLVICSSSTEAAEIGRLMPSVTQRVRVVPQGIDAEAIADARPFQSERRVILSIGRADGRGRADRAISALPALGPEYELVVVRTGNACRRLEACADDLLVSERVRVLGRVSDAVLHAWLRTASVVLALSDADNGGLTLMEAACAGVPVIASETPTHREVARMIDDSAVRLVSDQASPLLIADEVARISEMRMNPLATLAVPSLKDVADQKVSLYSELLDDRLSSRVGTAAALPRAAANGWDSDLGAIR